MKKTAFAIGFLCLTVISDNLTAAPAPKQAPGSRWKAEWIMATNTPVFDYSVMHLRKGFQLDKVPEQFLVNVSADNRYELYVNGALVSRGPASGDLNHWRYERIDLAPQLRAGPNVLAAVVWNFGEFAPEFQVTWRAGFILQAEEPGQDALVRTGPGWRAIRNLAYTPLMFTSQQMRGYYVAGPGDRVDGAQYPWGWQLSGYDDRAWPAAIPAVGNGRAPGFLRGSSDGYNRWMLEPSPLPAMAAEVQRFAAVREVEGASVPEGFLAGKAPLVVPAHTRVRMLLDQGVLTTAYPHVVLRGGKGALVSLAYAEALYQADGRKGNRNEVVGRTFVGNRDEFLADGGNDRQYRPLWWRTFRFVEVRVETAGEPLEVADLRSEFTGYPFERKATFTGGGDRLQQILDTGWRTARLCAHETYVDCPYYEQLQYVGDTRIQALISYTMSGDARLARNAIRLIDSSRFSDGLTMSRAPTRQQQVIPPFSLWWIGMVHDYWRYVDDPAFCREQIPGVRAVLEAYGAWRNPDGTLRPMPWWNFADWVEGWSAGKPATGPDGSCAVLDLQLLLALQWAGDLEQQFGSAVRASEHRKDAERLAKVIRSRYWDEQRQLFADTTEKNVFSQHANSLAVIAGLVSKDAARALVTRTLQEGGLARCSYYFKYYLHEAVLRAGLGDRYLDLLGDWDQMLADGLTTFAERKQNTRSDCHAWSASPNHEMFRTVLGIEPAAPGFARVNVRPHPGKLERASGRIPHPRGWVAVEWQRVGDQRLEAVVTLPEGVEGTFEWRGQKRALKPGLNQLKL